MNQIRFRCRSCKEFVEMNRTIPDGFADWSYTCADWSNFSENVPELSEHNWMRSNITPNVGDIKTIKVQQPFDEKIGNEFNMEFEPASLYFSNWDDNPDEIHKCAIVRCMLNKVLLIDEYSAWISVKVISVTLLSELYKAYTPTFTTYELEDFAGIQRCDEDEFHDEHWNVMYWSGQGDIGENKRIYIDDKDIRHLVSMEYYSFHEEIVYIGNIITR